MTHVELKAAFGRLGPVQDVDRNLSGSKENVVLRADEDLPGLNAIGATRALAKAGLTLLKAKRAVEAVLSGREVFLSLPKVASREDLAAELTSAGIRQIYLKRPVTLKSKDRSAAWVQRIRRKAGLTQEQFAVVYGLDLKTLRKYEQGASLPSRSVMSYLQMIEEAPAAVKELRMEQ